MINAASDTEPSEEIVRGEKSEVEVTVWDMICIVWEARGKDYPASDSCCRILQRVSDLRGKMKS
jgi:hypothetical protein